MITDDDFTSIVGGIRPGRGIFDNLRKAMAFIVAVHVVIFGMSLVPVLGPTWPLVLLPVQIAFLELIIDPACSIVFEAEEIDPRIMDAQPAGPARADPDPPGADHVGAAGDRRPDGRGLRVPVVGGHRPSRRRGADR